MNSTRPSLKWVGLAMMSLISLLGPAALWSGCGVTEQPRSEGSVGVLGKSLAAAPTCYYTWTQRTDCGAACGGGFCPGGFICGTNNGQPWCYPGSGGGGGNTGPQCNTIELQDCLQAECYPLTNACPSSTAELEFLACLATGVGAAECAAQIGACAFEGLAYGPACACCLEAACNKPCGQQAPAAK